MDTSSKSHILASIRIGGNKFHAVDGSPPWAFPLDNVPIEQNTSRPPITQTNAVENYDPPKVRKQKKKRMGPGGIAFIVGAGTLLVTGFALFIAIRLNKLHRQRMEDYESNHSSLPTKRHIDGEALLVKSKNRMTESHANNINMISKLSCSFNTQI